MEAAAPRWHRGNGDEITNDRVDNDQSRIRCRPFQSDRREPLVNIVTRAGTRLEFAHLPSWDGHTRLPLAKGWALGADWNQWILYQAKKHRGKTKWQPIKFIASNSAVLRRLLREMGIQPTPEAEATMNAFPAEFLEWRATAYWGRR